MNPISVLHDHVSVEFVHPEFHSLDFSIQSTEQQKSSSGNARDAKVLIELSLIDSSDTESTKGD